jgi:hypothetical protein
MISMIVSGDMAWSDSSTFANSPCWTFDAMTVRIPNLADGSGDLASIIKTAAHAPTIAPIRARSSSENPALGVPVASGT